MMNFAFWLLIICAVRIIIFMSLHPHIAGICKTFEVVGLELVNFLFSFGIIFVFLAFLAYVRYDRHLRQTPLGPTLQPSNCSQNYRAIDGFCCPKLPDSPRDTWFRAPHSWTRRLLTCHPLCGVSIQVWVQVRWVQDAARRNDNSVRDFDRCGAIIVTPCRSCPDYAVLSWQATRCQTTETMP